jgi:hypothetical protein
MLEICHWRLVQVPMFGIPAILDDAQVPAAAGVDGWLAPPEEPEDEPPEDELDEPDEGVELDDGAVGVNRLLLLRLENSQPPATSDPSTIENRADL